MGIILFYFRQFRYRLRQHRQQSRPGSGGIPPFLVR
jgi:hypothetical protein